MTINSASTNERYTIKDKGDNKLIFTSSGYLYKIVDSNGNTATLSYNGTILKSITDGAGRTIQLDVNANGYLVGIIDPSGRRTSFAYTGINLTKITYPDGKYSTYTYDTYNNLKSAVNHDGYKINYQYYQVAPYRVSDIGEYGAENTAGMGLHINYGYNTTIFNDQDGKKNIYQFNDWGNTISVRDEHGNALYYKYGEIGGESNKLKLNSKLQKPIMNYLKNHNAEIVGNWTAVNEYVGGDTDGSNIYDTTYKYLGKQSLRIKKVDPVKSRLYKQTLSLEKGKEYTFSAYVKTVGISNKNGKGASLFIKYQDETGTWEILDEAYIYISGTNDWERQEVNFTIPNNASTNTVEVNVGIVEEAGTAYFDCMQLEEGSAANRYNILENANFSYGMDFWTKNYECDILDTIVTSTDATYPIELDKDKKVFKINGSASKRKNIYQKIDLSGKAGDVFVVSGWAKGDSVPITGTRYFALDVGIEKNDGSYEWKVVKFNEDSTEWQYVSDKIITSADYKSITFYGLYYENENTAYFDGLQLYKEEFGQSYTYDDKGNVISTSDLAEQNSTFEYANNDLVKSISPSGNQFKYEYDGNHNITKATSAENAVYSFSYDSNGNPETATIGDTTNGLTIKSTAEYTSDKNYIKSIEDSSGNKVGYDYNTKKGTLDRVTDAKGNSVFYSYDEMDRLKEVYSVAGSSSSEVFTFGGTTTGTKGTKPSVDNAVYDKDENGKTVLKAADGNKVLYNLNINQTAGTMSAWIKPGTSGTTRYILDSQGTNSAILSMYIGTDNKLNLAVRYEEGGAWYTLITSSDTVNVDQWNFVAFKWSKDTSNNLNFYLYLNDKVYLKENISSATIKDFTGAQTSVGTHNTGSYSINGLVDEFIYSSEVLDDTKISSIRTAGRGKYLSSSNINNSYAYENDRIKSVTHNGFSYNFGYDNLGNNTTVAVGNQNLITNNYEPRTSRLEGSVYGNGDTVSYVYDEEDRVIADKYDGVEKFKYNYDASGNLAYHEDLVNNVDSRYFYDASERLVKIIEKDKNDPSKKSSMYYDYDIESNLKNFIESINGAGHITSYEYDKDSKITDVYYNNPLKNVGNMENFPLNNTTTGSNGTKSYSQTGVNFAVDSTVENGKKVLTTDSTTKILYDLGIDKESGTMGAWFTTKSSGTTRYILASEGKDNAILSMYLDANNKLNLAIRNSSGGWVTLKTSTDVVAVNTWNYAAFTWTVAGGELSAKLYLNDKVYISTPVTTTDFKDFTGATTAVGGHNSGSYQLNGQLEQFSFYNTALSDDEVKAIHAKGRGNRVNYSYDELGRLEERKLSTGVFTSDTTYEFEAGQDINTTTTRVNKISNDGKEITYTYDANGNIETITENGKVIKYYYDELNQLVREDNEVLNKTIVYTYDVGGNITSKKEHAYTTGTLGDVTKAYGYEYTDANWKDVLTKFDGKTIEYDAIGNPKKYGVKNDNVFDETKNYQSYTWEHGRQLKSMVFVDGEGNKYDLEFKYNSSGIRTEKKVVQGQNTVITKYHLVADKVTYEDNGTDKIYYTYDNSDNLVSMNLNDVEYYYIRNAQGDIIGLFDGTGAQVVSYVYDSWGKLVYVDGALKDTVGVKNPYRYRGYRYDTETGLYYLNSRYYNAEWGRFINADGYVGETGTLLSCNMFAYCQNNIINYYDPSGRWLTLPLLGGVLTGVVETAAAILSAPVVVGGALVLATGFLIYSGYQYYTSRASSNSGDSSNDTAVNHQEDVDVEIVIPRNRYPETAQHVEDAIESGHPDTLTVDRSKAKSNRRKSLKGIPKVKGKDLDEYPPAMFKEGGAGSSVRPLNPSDNRGSGSWLGHKLRAFPDGTRVRIKVGPK